MIGGPSRGSKEKDCRRLGTKKRAAAEGGERGAKFPVAFRPEGLRYEKIIGGAGTPGSHIAEECRAKQGLQTPRERTRK